MILPLEGPLGQDQKLPFPTRPLRVGDAIVEEYIIPADRKQEVLEQLYIFEGVPSLDDEVYDLHEGKKFVVREFRVTWEHGQNWLVSPYYPNSGGTVIDWMPADWDDDDEDEDDDDGWPDEDDEDDDWDDDDEQGWDDDDDEDGEFDADKPPF